MIVQILGLTGYRLDDKLGSDWDRYWDDKLWIDIAIDWDSFF